VGAGNGGRTGEDPPSNVELVEKAGDPGCSDARILSGPSSALAAGGGDDFNEDVVANQNQYALRRVHICVRSHSPQEDQRRRFSSRPQLCLYPSKYAQSSLGL